MNSEPRGNVFFINTVLLGGTPEDKIVAARAAGFDQVEIWQQDLSEHAGGPSDMRVRIQKECLGITDYQVLRDFDGAPDAVHEKKRAEALFMLDIAQKLGTDTILTTASSDRACDPRRIEDDLRWLAKEAATRKLRIAYEGLAWSSVNFTLAAAWKTVQCVNEANLGIVVDPYHIFVRGCDASDLDGIPVDRIFIVQLSDSFLDNCADLQLVIDTARHHRVFPGQGSFPIDTILRRLKTDGYTGPIGIEVFNDEMKALDPKVVAQEAMAALKQVWPK